MKIISIAVIYCGISMALSLTVSLIKNDKTIFEKSLYEMWHTMIFAIVLAIAYK